MLVCLGALILGASGCSRSDIGVRCEIGEEAEGESGLVLNLRALDCMSKICIFQATSINPDQPSRPRCTQSCGKCPGPGPNCEGGYLCRIPTITGDARCCSVCVCADDLTFEQRQADPNISACEEIKQQEQASDPDFEFSCP